MANEHEQHLEAVKLPSQLHARVVRLADAKNCSLAEALAYVVAHGFEALERKLDHFQKSKEIDKLPPKQRLVLEGLREGLSVKELADKLKISEPTIRTHIIRSQNLFVNRPNHALLSKIVAEGGQMKKSQMTEQFDFEKFLETYPSSIVMFFADSKGLRPASPEPGKVSAGTNVYALIPKDELPPAT